MAHELMIVEDDDDIRQSLAEILQDEGHEVQTASNGAEALERLEKRLQHGRLPCLILLDLMMPVMNGWDFRVKQLSDPTLADVGRPALGRDRRPAPRRHAARRQLSAQTDPAAKPVSTGGAELLIQPSGAPGK